MSMKGKLPIIFHRHMSAEQFYSTINKVEGAYCRWVELHTALYVPTIMQISDKYANKWFSNTHKRMHSTYIEYMRQANRVRPRSKMMKQIILTDRKPNNQVKP